MITKETARLRAAMMDAVRGFFTARGFLEVDVPVMAAALIPEAHIEVFATTHVHPYESDRSYYLIPSPEVHLKRLLAEGWGDIYSIGKCFRNAESRSRLHNPEFTMLEWYASNADYTDSMALTTELLAGIARFGERHSTAGTAIVGAPPLRITVAESFERYAGVSGAFEHPDAMRRAARQLEMRAGDDESVEDLFQRILLTHVEPNLPTDRPVFLCDYPLLVPTLALASRTNPGFAERWELYINGVEIANCYSEERDADRIRAFLSEQARAKQAALVVHPADDSLERFAAAPPCTGVAMGVDRLLMSILGIDDIGGVIFSR